MDGKSQMPVARIELAALPYHGGILPLNYTGWMGWSD